MEPKSQQNIEHRWTLLCEGSSIDRKKNNLTLFNIIEQLNISIEKKIHDEEIIVPVSMELVTLWGLDNAEKSSNADVEIDFVDPEKKVLNTIKYKLEIPEKIRRGRSIGSIKGLKVTKSGDYIFRIKIKPMRQTSFIVVGEISLEINLTDLSKVDNVNPKTSKSE